MAQSVAEDPTAFDAVADGGFILVVVVVSIVLGRVAGVVTRAVIGKLARRSLLAAHSGWRVRVPRLVAETVPVAELRREHRLNAAAAMITRVIKVVIWLVAVVVVLDWLHVDLLIAVSGAGFLGAAVAIGGQNSVHDYLNGMHVLLEDRFGAGDQVQLTLDGGGDPIEGTVTRLGAFATRIETDNGTFHLANRRAHQVLNLSQREHPRLFDLQIPVDVKASGGLPRLVAELLSGQSQIVFGGDLGLVVDSAERPTGTRRRNPVRVSARFSRALTDDELARLVEAANAAAASIA